MQCCAACAGLLLWFCRGSCCLDTQLAKAQLSGMAICIYFAICIAEVSRRNLSVIKAFFDCRKLGDGSPVAGYLSPGDVILSINQCPVMGSRDWVTCLIKMPASPLYAAAPQSGSPDALRQAVQPGPSTGMLDLTPVHALVEFLPVFQEP